jgi:bacteriocin-like protein
MEKKPPHAAPRKEANSDPKISKDELSDSDLNKVTGGSREVPHRALVR